MLVGAPETGQPSAGYPFPHPLLASTSLGARLTAPRRAGGSETSTGRASPATGRRGSQSDPGRRSPESRDASVIPSARLRAARARTPPPRGQDRLSAHGGRSARNARIVTDGSCDYHQHRAQGGVGLIVAFGFPRRRSPRCLPTSVSLWNPSDEPALRRLATEAHAQGAVLLAQATPARRPRESARRQCALVGPSALNGPPPFGAAHALSIREVQEIVARFAGPAASMLARCGWDGIEITSFGTHLIEQFWSPDSYRRDDRYGGAGRPSPLRHGGRRSRRRGCPHEFLVAFRMTGDPMTTRFRSLADDMVAIAGHMDRQGRIDLFDISGGSGAPSQPTPRLSQRAPSRDPATTSSHVKSECLFPRRSSSPAGSSTSTRPSKQSAAATATSSA